MGIAFLLLEDLSIINIIIFILKQYKKKIFALCFFLSQFVIVLRNNRISAFINIKFHTYLVFVAVFNADLIKSALVNPRKTIVSLSSVGRPY